MKIVISGYGRMGHEIEATALARGHKIVARLAVAEDWANFEDEIKSADVVIDFSTPASVVDNIRKCFDLGIPVVTGTTGWNDAVGQVKKWCEDEKQSFFTATNFSIGVNILYSITAHLSRIVDHVEDYNISLEEIHHIHKLDSPSGTAIKIAEIILENTGRKTKWVNRAQVSPEELQVISIRDGEVPGIHTISCESDYDRLVLRHEAKGRKGFAIGALLAAEWLQGKKGFFNMGDMLPIPR